MGYNSGNTTNVPNESSAPLGFILRVQLLAAQAYTTESTGLSRVEWTVPQALLILVCLRVGQQLLIHNLLSAESPQGMLDHVLPLKHRNYSLLWKQMVYSFLSLKNVSQHNLD